MPPLAWMGRFIKPKLVAAVVEPPKIPFHLACAGGRIWSIDEHGEVISSPIPNWDIENPDLCAHMNGSGFTANRIAQIPKRFRPIEEAMLDNED